MRASVPAAARIGALVNTHANGGHCYGNQLVADARIIASRASAAEMDELPPPMVRAIENAKALGPGGEFLARIFSPFEFRGIRYTPPTETFDGELRLRVGRRRSCCSRSAPPTRGDVLVWLPSSACSTRATSCSSKARRSSGPARVELDRACERIEARRRGDRARPRPAHRRQGALEVRDYLVHVSARPEAYDAGLSPADAPRELPLGEFAAWGDSERIAVNVNTLYREWSGGAQGEANAIELFGLMAELAARRGARGG